jgi:8-oxo-dGTP diphosphatase
MGIPLSKRADKMPVPRCRARLNPSGAGFHRMAKRNTPPVMAAAVIERVRDAKPEVLIARRGSRPHENKWCFPGGTVEKGESPEAGLRRLLKEQLNIAVPIQFGQPPLDHSWDGMIHRWRFFFCDGSDTDVNNTQYDEVRWVISATLREYDFEPVSQQVVDWLLEDRTA